MSVKFIGHLKGLFIPDFPARDVHDNELQALGLNPNELVQTGAYEHSNDIPEWNSPKDAPVEDEAVEEDPSVTPLPADAEKLLKSAQDEPVAPVVEQSENPLANVFVETSAAN